MVSVNTNPNTGGRVLVVDDNQSITELLKPLLAAGEFDVEVATDGASALELIQTSMRLW